MITLLPFVFEPCRNSQEEIEKSVFEKYGDDIQPLWVQILICFQAYFLTKYRPILKNWKNIFPPPPDKIQKDEFRKALSRNLKLIKSASERESFKKEAKELFKIVGPKRLSSPKYMNAMEKDYKRILEDAKETLISQLDYVEILNKGKEKGFITDQEIDRLLELRKDSDGIKFGEEMYILLGRFPDREREALENAWGVASECARRYSLKKTEQNAIWEVVRRILRSPSKIPIDHRYSVDEIRLRVCKRYRRNEAGGGSIKHYYYKSVARERKNCYVKSKRQHDKKPGHVSLEIECPCCPHVFSIQIDQAKKVFCPKCGIPLIPEEPLNYSIEDNSKFKEWESQTAEEDDPHVDMEDDTRMNSEEDFRSAPACSDKTIKEKKPPKRREITALQWKELSPRERQITKLRNRKIPVLFEKIGQRFKIRPGTARKTWSNAKLKLEW